MRQGWQMKTLNEVCKDLFAGGDVPKDRSSKFLTNEYNIPIFSNGAKRDGLYGYTDIARVKEPSITVSARGTIGYSSIRTEAYLPVVRLIVLVPDKELITLHFLKYVIETMDFGNSGSSIPQLTIPMIKKYQLLIPKLQEQKQIVALLDKAFTAIDQAKANIEKNIVNAKELFQSKLNEIFSQKGEGWEEKKMDEVCEIASKLINPKEAGYQKLLHVGGGNIVTETGELIKLKTCKEEGLKSGKFAFDTRVILYNKIRPYLVKVAKPNFSGLCSADMYPLTPNKKEITRDFLYFLLISKDFTNYAIGGSERAGMPKVNRKHLFEYTFSLPTIKTQISIIKELESLMVDSKNLDKEYRKKLNNLEELKKSILQKAFSGELTQKEVEV
jgi:type I restriction enzyme S subunit